MNEKISIRRTASGVMVNVTQKVEENSVHWQVRVLGPTAALISSAIQCCRINCKMLLEGIEQAEDREEQAA